MKNIQQGLSIVELLVALTISSFLILGVTQIYLNNRATYLFQGAQTENQVNTRYTFLILEQELTKAGYRRRPDMPYESVFPSETVNNCAFEAGQTVKIDNGAICVRYEPASRADADCQGNLPSDVQVPAEPYISTGHRVTERFSINSQGQLLCNNSVINDGISSINFEYGVGSATDRVVDEYSNNPGSRPIRSIRYAALMASGKNMRQGMGSATLNGWKAAYPNSSAAAANFDVGQVFQVVQGSVALRSLLP